MSKSTKSFSAKKQNSINNLTNPLYTALQQRIKEVRTKTDAKAPFMKIDNFLRPVNIVEDTRRYQELVRNNLELLTKLNVISRTTGLTKNYNEADGVRVCVKLEETINNVKKIQKDNASLYKRFTNVSGKLPTRKELLKDWENNLRIIRTTVKKPIMLPELMLKEHKFIASHKRPVIFMDLGLDKGLLLGRLVIVLFYDIVPRIVINFLKLCCNPPNEEESGDCIREPSIANTIIFRIFPGLYLEGGDMLLNNGYQGMSADGSDFKPDNFDVSHRYKGVLAMTPNSCGKVNSLFTISFKPLNVLNRKRAAFGRVLNGMKVLDAVELYGSKNGKPKKNIVITKCGMLSNYGE